MSTQEITLHQSVPVATPTVPQAEIWQRQPDEPTKLYDWFFCYYLPLGPKRSILSAYKSYRLRHDPKIETALDCTRITSVPDTWNDYAKRYHWIRRATAYDDHQRALWYEQTANLATYVQQEILSANLALLQGAASGVAHVKWEKTAPNALSNAIKAASAQLIALLPPTTGPGPQIQILVNGLPSDVRSRLLVALELDNK